MRKRSTHARLTERKIHRLQDLLKKDMWKVAFEPERRESADTVATEVFPYGSR